MHFNIILQFMPRTVVRYIPFGYCSYFFYEFITSSLCDACAVHLNLPRLITPITCAAYHSRRAVFQAHSKTVDWNSVRGTGCLYAFFSCVCVIFRVDRGLVMG
jgi:hypothetical protein